MVYLNVGNEWRVKLRCHFECLSTLSNVSLVTDLIIYINNVLNKLGIKNNFKINFISYVIDKWKNIIQFTNNVKMYFILKEKYKSFL